VHDMTSLTPTWWNYAVGVIGWLGVVAIVGILTWLVWDLVRTLKKGENDAR